MRREKWECHPAPKNPSPLLKPLPLPSTPLWRPSLNTSWEIEVKRGYPGGYLAVWREIDGLKRPRVLWPYSYGNSSPLSQRKRGLSLIWEVGLPIASLLKRSRQSLYHLCRYWWWRRVAGDVHTSASQQLVVHVGIFAYDDNSILRVGLIPRNEYKGKDRFHSAPLNPTLPQRSSVKEKDWFYNP